MVCMNVEILHDAYSWVKSPIPFKKNRYLFLNKDYKLARAASSHVSVQWSHGQNPDVFQQSKFRGYIRKLLPLTFFPFPSAMNSVSILWMFQLSEVMPEAVPKEYDRTCISIFPLYYRYFQHRILGDIIKTAIRPASFTLSSESLGVEVHMLYHAIKIVQWSSQCSRHLL